MQGLSRVHGAPLYHQVYLAIRNDILSGRYRSGDSMPGENVLAAQYNVSRVTIRKALDRLNADSLIERVRGSGTFVGKIVEQVPIVATLSNFSEHAQWLAENTEVKLLRLEYMTPPLMVAEVMGLPPDSTVQHSIRLRSYAGKPFLLLHTFLPEWVAEKYPMVELERSSLHFALRRAGIRFQSAEQKVTAVAADAALAQILDVPVGAPLLSVTWIERDDAERVIEYLDTYARPDVYELRASYLGDGEERDRAPRSSAPVPERKRPPRPRG